MGNEPGLRGLSGLLVLDKPGGWTSRDAVNRVGSVVGRKARVGHAGTLDPMATGVLVVAMGQATRLIEYVQQMPKTYLAQVEGEPDDAALEPLRRGLRLKDGPTLPARAERIPAPELWPRDPPVRFRKTVPDSWISLTLREGRNRQVRRMTAAIGLPTLRLVRWSIGDWSLDGLQPGQWREITVGP